MRTETQNRNNHSELSKVYYDSHKHLMLFSGLLFIYEFVGIKVPNKPIPNTDFEILTPESVPFLLVLLIFYFFYRTLIGWFQSDTEIRKLIVQRYEFWPTMIIPIVSIALYIYQLTSKQNVAVEIFGSGNIFANTISIFLGVIVIGLITFTIVFYFDFIYSKHKTLHRFEIIAIIFILLFFTMIIVLIRIGFLTKYFIYSGIFSMLLAILWVIKLRIKQNRVRN